MFLLNTILLVLSAAFLALAIIKNSRSCQAGSAVTDAGSLRMNRRLYMALLLSVLLFGIAARLWQFGIIPGGVNQDGAMAGVDGKALADYGTDRFGTWLPCHLYAWGFGQMSSLLSYMVAPLVRLFGLSVVTLRLPLLIASVFGALFFYLFMRDIFGPEVGLISAFIVAVNPWHFMQSRWALDCNLLPHFFMGGLYFLNRGLSGKKRFLYISMVFFGLCMYCYGITVYTIPLFLLVVCIFYTVKKRLSFTDAAGCALVYLLIAWPFILTMAVNFFRWDSIALPFVTIQYFPDSIRSGDILFFSGHPLQQLWKNICSLTNITILQRRDLPWNDMPGFGTMYLFTLPFAAGGLIQLHRSSAGSEKQLVLFSLLTGIWVGLVTDSVNVNRVNIIFYALMMLNVLGIYYILQALPKTLIPMLCAFVLSASLMLGTYFGGYAGEIKYYFYGGFGEALEAAEASGADRLYICLGEEHANSQATAEILTLFYDRTDAQYFQGKDVSSDGRLPYRERYTYISSCAELSELTGSAGAAFVAPARSASVFDGNGYTVTVCGSYCAAVKN